MRVFLSGNEMQVVLWRSFIGELQLLKWQLAWRNTTNVIPKTIGRWLDWHCWTFGKSSQGFRDAYLRLTASMIQTRHLSSRTGQTSLIMLLYWIVVIKLWIQYRLEEPVGQFIEWLPMPSWTWLRNSMLNTSSSIRASWPSLFTDSLGSSYYELEGTWGLQE